MITQEETESRAQHKEVTFNTETDDNMLGFANKLNLNLL